MKIKMDSLFAGRMRSGSGIQRLFQPFLYPLLGAAPAPAARDKAGLQKMKTSSAWRLRAATPCSPQLKEDGETLEGIDIEVWEEISTPNRQRDRLCCGKPGRCLWRH